MSTNASLSPEPTLPEKDRRVSPWWRALAYVLAIVLGLVIASAMSMFEQFKAQIGHMQKQLQVVSQIKSISVLTDELRAPVMLTTQDPRELTLQLQRQNASDKDLAHIDTVAISVENRGGVDPAKGPRLPYLFQGAAIQKSR
jgi:anti-sigma-K factor RskA